MKKKVTYAYTLGGTESYDSGLAERDYDKCIGGVAFRTAREAQARIDAAPKGMLPPEWVDGKKIPASVYRLAMPKPYSQCTEPDDFFGCDTLTIDVPIIGKARVSAGSHRQRLAEKRKIAAQEDRCR